MSSTHGGDERQQPHAQKQSKKRKKIYPYGNYENYYGYRIGKGEDSRSKERKEEDLRLKVLKKEWFQGKDCLDIGCNSGIITIQIAKIFCCKTILGVDIDDGLIKEAYWNVRNFLRVEKAGNLHHNNIPPVSGEKDLSDIVSFRKENFVESQDTRKKQYDTIICLSVAKWIHLNWGDDGLITLFTKVWRLLRPGGIFVLEPQPWKSYEKNRKVSETARTNYKNIMIHPEYFQDLLLDEIGFRTVEACTSSESGSKSGFDRPILVFRK